MAFVTIRPGHVQPLWAGHPWVYAQAIEDVQGSPEPGDVVRVLDPRGQPLGAGYWSPRSAIPVRILCRDAEQELESSWIKERIGEAQRWRKSLLQLPSPATDSYRLLHAEGDGVAGLIADVYGRVVAVQFLTVGMKRRERQIAAALMAVARVTSVVEVLEPQVHAMEGFSSQPGLLAGDDASTLHVQERDLAFDLDRSLAQKTGFYFDQRENRAQLESFASGARMLDACSYVGAFGIGAARAGAERVLAVDRSASALAAGSRAARRLGLGERIEFVRADVKRELIKLAQSAERFELVSLDPPKLAKTHRDLKRARKAYRHLNALALRVVAPGGVLVTSSCSAAMRPDDFLRTLALAAQDARRHLTLLTLRGQAADHPTPPAFAEGRYLKCAFLRVA